MKTDLTESVQDALMMKNMVMRWTNMATRNKEFEIRVMAKDEEEALDLVGRHCFMFVREVNQNGN